MSFIHGVKVLTVDEGSTPIRIAATSVVGIVGTAPDAVATAFPLNTPVAITSPGELVAALGATGTLPAQIDAVWDQIGTVIVAVRVEEGANETATLANVAGSSASGAGVHALKAAQSMTGYKPRLLAAAGHTHQRPDGNANPVAAELVGVAGALRAIAFVDGPSTSTADAVNAVSEVGSSRVYFVDPLIKVINSEGAAVPQGASARLAGLQAQIDNDLGFWHSLSNKTIAGITGLVRPVVFSGSDATAESNLLNAAGVGTIVRNGGFRAWGNYAADGTTFISSQRIRDVWADSVEDTMIKRTVDRPINGNTIIDIESDLNAFNSRLTGLGAIIGGSVTLNRQLNTKESLASGMLYIDAAIGEAVPLQSLVIRLHSDNGFYETLFEQVAA